MRKLIATIALIVACAPLARGQCSPNPCYTDNKPTPVLLTASQVAAQGGMAVTVNMSAPGAIGTFHNGTFGVGTQVTVNWTGYNTTALSLYYEWDSSGWVLWYNLSAAGGNLQFTTTPDMIGHNIHIKLVGSSSGSTQDIANYTVVNQAEGTYSNDGNPDNTYVEVNTSGGGGSMLADFTECQGGEIHQCINATHTPYTTLTLNNTTQGTSNVNLKHQSGNIAGANQAVSFGDSIIIAASSNDVLDFEEDDEVDCSVSGPIPLPNYHLRIVPYQIFDKVDSYDGKVRFQVEPWCYNCCIPAKQGCPEPITLTDHVTYSPGGNPPKIPTFFYSLGFCANGNFPGMVSGQWECSPGLAIPFYGSGWIKAYCTPYENPPY